MIPTATIFQIPRKLSLATTSVLNYDVFATCKTMRGITRLHVNRAITIVTANNIKSDVIRLTTTCKPHIVITISASSSGLRVTHRLNTARAIGTTASSIIATIQSLANKLKISISFRTLKLPRAFTATVRILSSNNQTIVINVTPANDANSVSVAHLIQHGLRVLNSCNNQTQASVRRLLALTATKAVHPSRIVAQSFSLSRTSRTFTTLSHQRVINQTIVHPRT